jgi:hypothetical protein
MEVFLIPLGAERHELYCEASPSEGTVPVEPAQTSGGRGFFAGLRHKFTEVLAAAEHDRSRRANGEHRAPTSMWGRLKARALAWIADAIAEQRLLWYLRHEDAATLHYPSDLSSDRAMQLARASLTRDRDRHLRWLAVDSLLMILSVALVLIPGPNVLGYYFAFRVVGHFLSWRGARQGLDRVRWELRPSEPLLELRNAIGLAPPQRERRLLDIATRLRLDQLPTFVERVAYPGA